MTILSDDKASRPHRFDWVDIAKGICIVAVVGLYARNELKQVMGDAGWLDPWSAFAQPFRMPDFFLLSGLFLSSVMNRPWRSYLDTKVVHYVYFLVLWVTILATYDMLYLGTAIPPHPGWTGLLKLYAWELLYPDHMLWFLQTLPVFFVVTRLLRHVPPLLLWGVAALALASRVKTGVPLLDNAMSYYAFFLAGHFGAPWFFALADRAAQHRGTTLLLFIAWCFFNQWAVSSGATALPGGSLLFGFIGITAVIAFSSLLAPIRAMRWLRYAGSNSIVIYLGFFMPLTAFVHAVGDRQWQVDPHLLATLTVVLGAGAPVLLFLFVKGTALRVLFVRPAWAHLVRPRVERVHAGMAGAPKS